VGEKTGAADDADRLVQALGVSVRDGGHTLLETTTIEAAPGESVCLTGPNGSGKTTLLRVLAGLLRAYEGAALVAGTVPNLRTARFRRAVSYSLSPAPFSYRLTVAEHLALVALTWGASPVEADRLASARLEELEAGDLADRFPHQLSAGEAQAASLSVALIRPFAVLLLDEPEQSLDDARLEALAGALRRVNGQGAAVVAATHSRSLVDELGARTLQLRSDRR
jgi:ABC-type multidrug transport system ATPase subunit